MALLLAVVPPTFGLATVASAHTAEAITTAEAIATADEPVAAEGSGPGWGPILGACFGVLFGGALALWQIRGMKNRS